MNYGQNCSVNHFFDHLDRGLDRDELVQTSSGLIRFLSHRTCWDLLADDL